MKRISEKFDWKCAKVKFQSMHHRFLCRYTTQKNYSNGGGRWLRNLELFYNITHILCLHTCACACLALWIIILAMCVLLQQLTNRKKETDKTIINVIMEQKRIKWIEEENGKKYTQPLIGHLKQSLFIPWCHGHGFYLFLFCVSLSFFSSCTTATTTIWLFSIKSIERCLPACLLNYVTHINY